MNIRDALIYQSPSLELQRAAADEIASLDARLAVLQEQYVEIEAFAYRNAKYLWEGENKICDLENYLEAHDLTKEFEEWLKRNTEE